MVRTRAFQACNGGSTPPGVTTKNTRLLAGVFRGVIESLYNHLLCYMADPRESDPLVSYSHPERLMETPVLADGSELYQAFLEGLLVADARATEAAKNRFDAIAGFDPESVARCAGMSPQDARVAFEEIEARMNQRDVA